VYGHERDRVHEAFGIEEPFKVVVLFFLLNIALKFVHIKVSLGMPLLVLKVLHVGNGVLASEFTL
jgi:F0F1-type ATP synthase assembly protein I